MKHRVSILISPDCEASETAERLRRQFHTDTAEGRAEPGGDLTLQLDAKGLALICDGQKLQGDLTRMLPRLKQNNLAAELLVRAARIKGAGTAPTAIDATAGLGEDSLLLAAAGFHVKLYERNPIIFELLRDALLRAEAVAELSGIVARMQLFHQDSILAMQQMESTPDVIFLDPMFPERQKSALVKKKLQMIQKLEFPCVDEWELILSAMGAGPKKLIIKRPPKGPYLAGIRPDYSLAGKAVRFDCFVSPYDRIEKFTQQRQLDTLLDDMGD